MNKKGHSDCAFTVRLNISDRESGKPQTSIAEDGTEEEWFPDKIVPQRRSLIVWAVHYFDEWLACKDSNKHSNLKDFKPRCWKKGTIDAFFQLKDEIYLSRKSSHVAGIGAQGEKFYLLTQYDWPSD
jgi:hypothetical protein